MRRCITTGRPEGKKVDSIAKSKPRHQNSMAGKGLNNEQVVEEMNKMVAFIKQEAIEKARETKVRADEEFQLEKGKLVRGETAAIDAFFAKKVKAFEVQCKIKASHAVNRDRLTVLELRNSLLADLVAQAKGRLASVLEDQAAYPVLLKALLLQVLTCHQTTCQSTQLSSIPHLALKRLN
jgi:hypothetical protein